MPWQTFHNPAGWDENNAALVTALGDGPLRLKSADGSELKYRAHGGFLEVYKNKVTVLTDKIEEAA